MRRIRLAKSGYIFSSAAFCIAGLLLLLHPEISAEVLCKGLGILFLVWGFLRSAVTCPGICTAWPFSLI